MRRPRFRSRPLRALATALVLAAIVWVAHPWPLPLRWLEPTTTAYVEDRLREARALEEELEIRRSWIPLEEISPHVVRAVLLGEDQRFRDHRGVDWDALAEELRFRGNLPPRLWVAEDREALRTSLAFLRERRGEVRGRSTITQQLARNLYLSPDRSLRRKAQELLIARRLELLLPKERILELYLNVAELGPGIFGVEAASQIYFGRSARDLTPIQAAALAATLPHPRTSNPALNPARMAWRRELILDRMLGRGPDAPIPDPIRIDPPQVPPDSIPARVDTSAATARRRTTAEGLRSGHD